VGSGLGAALGAAVNLDVFIIVTRKVVLLDVLGVSLARSHAADSPIGFMVTVENRGNVGSAVTVNSVVLNQGKTEILSSRVDGVLVPVGVKQAFPLNLSEEVLVWDRITPTSMFLLGVSGFIRS